jgi:hypothetical protein
MSDENAAPGLRGETKFFFEDKTIDAVLAMVMTLGCEISALSEKLETVIDLLEARGVAGAADVAGFAPSEAQQARRDAARKILIESLLAPFQHDADMLARRNG